MGSAAAMRRQAAGATVGLALAIAFESYPGPRGTAPGLPPVDPPAGPHPVSAYR